MPRFTPPAGLTHCTVISGSFSDTYDGSTATKCGFKQNQSCLTEWTWIEPVNVNYLRILSYNYVGATGSDNHIYWMWGRVNGEWIEIARGTYHLASGTWYNVPDSACDNCTGIKIAQMHSPGAGLPSIGEVLIDYQEIPPEEGNATIVSITKPATFTPGESFQIRPKISNDGGDDTLFVRLINTDTGATLEENTHYTASGFTWESTWNVTLTQETDFHGRIEAGHEE